MPYVSELGTGQLVYLENQGEQTIFTIVNSSAGQQQQSTNSFTTGSWTAPPQILQTSTSVLLKIFTILGEQVIQIRGNSTTVRTDAKILPLEEIDSIPKVNLEPMEPMQPMQPMQPMKPMNVGGMSLKMGNMEMSMGNTDSTIKHFCSNCGTSVKPGDRFCSSCGHNLS
jgi:hypothetical protein